MEHDRESELYPREGFYIPIHKLLPFEGFRYKKKADPIKIKPVKILSILGV
jgi:hypothetical protein